MPADQLTAKPAGVPWEVAGALYVAGTTAYAAVQCGEARSGGHRRGRRRGGWRRLDRRPTGHARRCCGARHRGPSQRRMAQGPRRHPGQLRRRPGRATARGVAIRTRRRIPGLLRRRIRGDGGRTNSASHPKGSTPSSISPQSSSSGSGPRASADAPERGGRRRAGRPRGARWAGGTDRRRVRRSTTCRTRSAQLEERRTRGKLVLRP